MTIAAIETSYAGCRFRSRLEARWAVFFDSLRIPWEYEPQGYLVGEKQRPYLPDFWLPQQGVWVEVKGEMATLDLGLIDDAVNHPGGLPTADPYGELSMLVLGPVPEPDAAYLHWVVSRTVYAQGTNFCACHDLHFSQVVFQPFPASALESLRRENPGQEVRSPGATFWQIGRTLLRSHFDDIVTPRPSSMLVPDWRVLDALRAARSARFEHGESPRIPEPLDTEPPLVGAELRERMSAWRAEYFPDGAA
jgi:hypothetical protein